MQKLKKNKEVVETLQAYISPVNKAWLVAQAKLQKMPVSTLVDSLITLARKGIAQRP